MTPRPAQIDVDEFNRWEARCKPSEPGPADWPLDQLRRIARRRGYGHGDQRARDTGISALAVLTALAFQWLHVGAIPSVAKSDFRRSAVLPGETYSSPTPRLSISALASVLWKSTPKVYALVPSHRNEEHQRLSPVRVPGSTTNGRVR